MLAAIQSRKDGLRDVKRRREVTEVPDLVIFGGARIPARDEAVIHFRRRRKRAGANVQYAMIPKMRIAGKEDRHYRDCLGVSAYVCISRSKSRGSVRLADG